MTLTERIGIDLGTAGSNEALIAAAAEAGARRARVRFTLAGRSSVDDAYLAAASAHVDALRLAGLRVLAVLDSDLTVAPGGAGAFEDRPPDALAEAWSEEMVANAARLAGAIGGAVSAWEILPEPNRGTPPRIAPARWAALLAEIASVVRAAAPDATIVAGGLCSDDDDDGVDYLHAVLRAADETGTWSAGDPPYDAIGIRLSILAVGGPTEASVGAALTERTRRLWRVLENIEGSAAALERGVYVTGVGWDANRCGEDVQGRNAWTALDVLTADPVVRAVFWSALVDDEGGHGLYRTGALGEDDRRPAWQAFKDFSLYALQISPPAPPAVLAEPAVAAVAAVVAGTADDADDAGASSEAVAAPDGAMDDPTAPEAEPDAPPAVPAHAGAAGQPAQVIVFRIPDAAEVLRSSGLEGADLDAALAAVTSKYGGYEWLPPGEYSITVREEVDDGADDDTVYTNQQVISAMYRAGEGTWSVLERSGLLLGDLAARRDERYGGAPIAEMVGLTDDERSRVLAELAGIDADDAPSS